MATGYGPRSSRELRTCAAQCLGSQFAVRGRTGQVAPIAAGYGPRSSRGLCTFAAQCLGSQFAVRGRTGQVAPMAAGYGPRSSRGLRTCAGCSWSGIGKAWHTSWCVAARDKLRPWRRAMARAHQESCARARGVAGRGLEKPGILRGAWPHGTSRAHGGGLWPALIERVAHVRGVWLVRDWKGLAMGGVWPGAVHLGWSKSPRWMGARRCAGGSLPGRAGRKQVWAELFPR